MFFLVYIPTVVLGLLYPDSLDLIAGSVEIIACVLFFPVIPIFLTVLYYDICVRKEGWDLAFQCQALEELPA